MSTDKSIKNLAELQGQQLSFVLATATEKAYIAGILDGEGSICITRTTTRGEKIPRGRPGMLYEKHTLIVNIVNTHHPLLEKIHALYGGHIHTQRAIAGRKQCYAWYVRGHQAKRFLTDMQQFVLVKAEQVQLALRYLGLPKWSPDEKRALYEQMTALNGKKNYRGKAEEDTTQRVLPAIRWKRN